ncbi:MAG: NADH-quinone oxidoreductase subunit G [Desulfuromonas sp.]|nr:MAG: NADH-quinone oxidoreductase subunit G [Desulfuromonas sp.]
MVNLTIDGKQVTVKKTATIYEAAKEVGVDIPVLCYAKKLLPYGACRVCLVEVQQMKGRLIPACTTPVTEGMVVTTMSDEIRKVRKTVLEFLLVNHVIECPVCDKGGECDLQDLTYEYEVVTNRFEGEKFDLETDIVNPLIERNMNRCVLCGKCVRVCDEIVGYGSYSFINRGFETKIATAYDRDLNCEFCGQCVSMCPVGAILPRPFKYKARPWQLNEVDTVCGYCGNGCTVTLGVLDDKVETVRFNDKTGVNDGNLCIRGRFGYSYIHSDERLTKPLLRKNGQLVEVEWQEAIDAVVTGFKAAGEKLGILAGGRLTNEEYTLLKQLASATGTKSLDHSGGVCYTGVTEGVKGALGVAASTGTFPQVEECETILAIRSDFYETHPVFGMVVNQAVKRHNAELFVVSDKKGKLTKQPHASTLLTKPGLEVHILNAMAATLLEENLAVTEGVDDLDAYKASLADATPEKASELTGVPVETIRQAARSLAKADKAAILLAYGLPYSAQSLELGKAAANLAILADVAGKQGSGLYLCGEKANSQGAIDLGVMPAAGGSGAQEMLNGEMAALYIVGEDPLTSYPDRAKVENGLKKSPFVVVQDLFLTPTAQEADVVLPAASFAEKEGTFTNAERRLQRLRHGVPSPGEAKSDFTIFSQILSTLGAIVSYTGPAAVFAEIAQSGPYAGIALSDIGPQGVVWGGETLAVTKKSLQPVIGATPVEGEYLLVTGSCLYHSGTLSTKAYGPQSVVDAPYVELNAADAEKLKVVEGDTIKVSANGTELALKAKVGKVVPSGVVFAPNHFAQGGVNRLYKGETAVAVQLRK